MFPYCQQSDCASLLIVASDMSNPHGNNQHGIKICMYSLKSHISKLFMFHAFQTLQKMSCELYLSNSAKRRAGEKSRSGLSAKEQLMRLNEQFPKLNIQT